MMAGAAAVYVAKSSQNAPISFFDDFENGRAKWESNVTEKVEIVDSGDPANGKVLALMPGGEFVRALVKGSEGWNKCKVEADFLFPTSGG